MDITDEQLKELFDCPDKFLQLNDEKLDAVTRAAIVFYGFTSHPDLVEKLMLLYKHYVRSIHPAQRLRNYQSTVDRVLTGEIGVQSLMPFVCCDPSRPVASAAALDYIVLAPTDREHPTVAACELLELYERNVLANGLAVLGGLIMSGDRRILPLIKSSCRAFSCEEVEIFIKCRSTFLTAAVVEFYLEWLEDLDSQADCDVFAAVAAGFANLAIGATDDSVHDIERVIPCTPDNAVRILKSWTLSEYAAIIAGRLEEIAQREEGNPIMPVVMSMWGLT